MNRIVVAIDGPGGAGKSTVSRTLAHELGYQYVDTGAMYRVIGVLASEQGIAVDDHETLAALCDRTVIEFHDVDGRTRVSAAGRDFTDVIRTAQAAQDASRFSTVPAVRQRMVAQQRQLGARGGVVMEGRDIGTVVFPDAPVKVFLDASPRERARRRAEDLYGAGAGEERIAAIEREIAERDARDRGRAHSPLRPAADAVILDTTEKPIDEVVDILRALVSAKSRGLARYS
jgi:cytidylate kinase